MKTLAILRILLFHNLEILVPYKFKSVEEIGELAIRIKADELAGDIGRVIVGIIEDTADVIVPLLVINKTVNSYPGRSRGMARISLFLNTCVRACMQ